MIIFLYGEDTFRSRRKLKEFKDKFLSEVDPDGNSLLVLDGEKANIGQINEAVAAPSLFSRKRMIIIERLFNNKSKSVLDEACDYFKKIEKKDNENIVVFWDEVKAHGLGKNKLFIFLKNQRFAQEFKPLSNTEATRWVVKEARQKGAKISQQAALRLTAFFGSDLWQLSQEIEKLTNFKNSQQAALIKDGQEAEIGVSDIEVMVRGSVDENIFALTDAISHRNKARSLELLEKEIDSGAADSYLLHMIMRQFKILLQVRQAIENGMSSRKIINDLKLHPFVVQKSLAQARNFTLIGLKNILNKLLAIDRKVKVGQADFKTELALLFAQM